MISIYTSTCTTKCDESGSYQMYLLERVKWRDKEKIDIGSQVKYDRTSKEISPPQAGESTKTNTLSIYILNTKKNRQWIAECSSCMGLDVCYTR